MKNETGLILYILIRFSYSSLMVNQPFIENFCFGEDKVCERSEHSARAVCGYAPTYGLFFAGVFNIGHYGGTRRP